MKRGEPVAPVNDYVESANFMQTQNLAGVIGSFNSGPTQQQKLQGVPAAGHVRRATMATAPSSGKNAIEVNDSQREHQNSRLSNRSN